MTTQEFQINEKAILKSMAKNEIITKIEADKMVQEGSLIWVDSYTRDDGTKVKGYYRRK